jgi:putative membrane protein
MNYAQQPDLQLEKKLNVIAYVVSAVVLLLVGLMRQVKINLGIDFSFLPPIHASLNALCAVILLFALYFIKNKQVDNHRKAIYGALACSALFLVSYVLYHFTTPEIKYGDFNHDGVVSPEEKTAAGATRTFYLVLLFTHITLAGVILPFILLTFNRAFTGQYARHRKIARWVFPLWLYVAVTGPICYLMLKPFYP